MSYVRPVGRPLASAVDVELRKPCTRSTGDSKAHEQVDCPRDVNAPPGSWRGVLNGLPCTLLEGNQSELQRGGARCSVHSF